MKRIYFILIISSLFPLHANTEQKLDEYLKKQPWYDYETKDYKKYTDEEIEKRIPRQRQKQVRPFDPGAFSLSPGLITGFYYALLGLALAVILFILLRMKWSGPARKKKKPAPGNVIEVQHHGFKKEYIGDYERRIQKALSDGDLEMAGELIYFYALNRVEDNHVVRLEEGVTPTEALRILRYQNEPVSELFRPAALLFDRIAYALRPVERSEVDQALESVRKIGTAKV